MNSILPSVALTPGRVPAPGASDAEVVRFALSLHGYAVVGAEEAPPGTYLETLGAYLQTLDTSHPERLDLDALCILLFAKQRAHYFEGGGWPYGDPLMDEMRALTALIRERVAARGAGLAVWRGDLTRLDVDAVVNAANERMLGGGGVDGAIHRAAGPELLRACLAIPEVSAGVRCPTGEARITPGFDLPARYVIHTVGPVWHGGDRNEPDLLTSAYRSSLTLAAEYGLDTVAFPAISCGVYGYPVDAAAEVAVVAIRDFLATHECPRRALLVAFGAEVERALRAALG
jgi:O-acetyl-ADP-ribose deacetylase